MTLEPPGTLALPSECAGFESAEHEQPRHESEVADEPLTATGSDPTRPAVRRRTSWSKSAAGAGGEPLARPADAVGGGT